MQSNSAPFLLLELLSERQKCPILRELRPPSTPPGPGASSLDPCPQYGTTAVNHREKTVKYTIVVTGVSFLPGGDPPHMLVIFDLLYSRTSL